MLGGVIPGDDSPMMLLLMQYDMAQREASPRLRLQIEYAAVLGQCAVHVWSHC